MTTSQRDPADLMTAPADLLVGPGWLRRHLHDPRLRVVEVDVTATAYAQGHIDGAVLWNVYTDLKDADYATVDPDVFQELVRRSGITPDSIVVFHGYAPAMGLWMLRLFGHREVRILDASRDGWVAAGGSLTTEPSRPVPSEYVLGPQDVAIRALPIEVRSAMDDPGVALADVRSAAEYDGDAFWPSGGSEPGGRAGHVPGAIHVPVQALFDDAGRFRDTPALQEVFAPLAAAGSRVITYCTIGGRACTAWFVLTHLLGRPDVSVYDGSWAQWGRTPGAPVTS